MTETQKQFLRLLTYLYLQNGKGEKALILTRALEAIYPDDPEIALSRAYAEHVAGNHAAALQRADASLDANAPEALHTSALLIRSQSLWALGQEEAARASFSRYITNTAMPRPQPL